MNRLVQIDVFFDVRDVLAHEPFGKVLIAGSKRLHQAGVLIIAAIDNAGGAKHADDE